MTTRSTRKFGRYRLVGTMADGAMARLFLAVITGVDGFKRVVVLKEVLPHLSQAPEFTQMFLNEARLAARLDHPNIVRTFELGEIDGNYFISMEYLPGEDLTRILYRAHKEKHLIPVTVAATIAQNVADALQFAHDLQDDQGQSLGLVHRDVSLGNILVTYHGTTKLADFGIAKATAVASEISTRVGVFKGKYAYAAPEQVLGKEVDARTDIFSLGVVLWEMLAVRRLFKRANEAATIHAVQKAEVPPLSTIRSDVPAELEAIVMKALARKPKDRFQTPSEMSEALESILGRVSSKASSTLLKNWIVGLFGEDRAELKRAIAQGRGFEQTGEGAEEFFLSPEKAALLGLRPLPEVGQGQSHSSIANTPTTRERSSAVRPSQGGANAQPRSKSLTIEFPAVVATGGPHSSGAGPFVSEITSATTVMPRQTWSTDQVVQAELPFDPDSTWGSGSKSHPIPPQPEPPPSRVRHGIIGGTVAALLIILVSIGVLVVRRQKPASDAELALASEPPGASVSVDGVPTGQVTPVSLHNLPIARAVTLALEKEGFAPLEMSLQLAAGLNEKTVALDKLGRVRFDKVPPGSLIVIDEITHRADDVVELTAGQHSLRVEKDGEVVARKTITVAQGDQVIALD
jgi:serine/threonine protein kinase